MAIKHFKPAWWLKNPHLQTIWASRLFRKQPLAIQTKRLELPDGDFLDLAWVGKETHYNPATPIILILHGIAGNINSAYIQRILRAIDKRGWRGILMHFRGCSGTPNRLARGYHSGETEDLQYVVTEILRQEPQAPLFAIGYSLGGNVLLKWLGENGQQGIENPLRAAVAISIPFELKKTVEQLNKGFSRLYQWRLLRELTRNHSRKFKTVSTAIDFGDITKVRDFWQFDNTITAPLHGFKSAEDYYLQSSSRQYLEYIQKPTLIVHAKDDPFTSPDSLPQQQEISSQIRLELTEQGGHVGFVAGNLPWKPIYWLDERILAYLEQQL
jgi:hypothetical protein